jgi:hypothetical protein
MSNEPEVLKDSDGRWTRRDVFIEELIAETGAEKEMIEQSMEELVESDILDTKTVGDSEYVQIRSVSAAIRFLLKNKDLGV